MAKPVTRTSPSLQRNKKSISYTQKVNQARINWQKPNNTFEWVVA